MVYTVNLKIVFRYIGVFGFQNFQKSVKYGPIYFNKKRSAEKCPLNWSCPLFLESAKLEFHCSSILKRRADFSEKCTKDKPVPEY